MRRNAICAGLFPICQQVQWYAPSVCAYKQVLGLHCFEYLIQETEYMVSINQVCYHVHRRPGGVLEETLAEFGERYVIHGEDFSNVSLPVQSHNAGCCTGLITPLNLHDFAQLNSSEQLAATELEAHLMCRYRYTTNCLTMSGTGSLNVSADLSMLAG